MMLRYGNWALKQYGPGVEVGLVEDRTIHGRHVVAMKHRTLSTSDLRSALEVYAMNAPLHPCIYVDLLGGALRRWRAHAGMTQASSRVRLACRSVRCVESRAAPATPKHPQ